MTKNKSTNNSIKNEQDLASLIEFLWIVNRRRPYRLSDFEPQTFLPDLSRLYGD